MRVDLFDFELPPERIALRPARPRDSARLLVVEGGESATERFSTCRSCSGPATCWCSTTPRSFPRSSKAGAGRRASARPCTSARDRANGGHSCATPSARASATRSTSAKASRRRLSRSGRRLGAAAFPRRRAGRTAARARRADAAAALYRLEARRPTRRTASDYQTMFAREEGAVAAPTAALHFTPRLLEALDARGIGRETLTLHVGAGTFLPVKAEDTDGHRMHAEWGRIDAATAERLNAARAAGGRLIAVGTTSLRLLESAADDRRRDPPVRRRHRDLHHAGLSLQGDRRADHQFPFAQIDPVHAGQRADGARRHEGGLCTRDRGGLPLLQLRRREPACCLSPRNNPTAASPSGRARSAPAAAGSAARRSAARNAIRASRRPSRRPPCIARAATADGRQARRASGWRAALVKLTSLVSAVPWSGRSREARPGWSYRMSQRRARRSRRKSRSRRRSGHSRRRQAMMRVLIGHSRRQQNVEGGGDEQQRDDEVEDVRPDRLDDQGPAHGAAKTSATVRRLGRHSTRPERQ